MHFLSYYLNVNKWTAIAFRPLRDIYFFGFGLLGNFYSKDMTLTVQWAIDDFQSEEYIKEFMDSEKDPEKKWFLVDIRQFGEKPVKVSKGSLIHCKVKSMNDDDSGAINSTFYGYNGEKEYYSALDGQEYDFDTVDSSHNNNFTSCEFG